MTEIVVGVDGSDGAQEALRWAHQEAALMEAQLTAVMARPRADQPHLSAGLDSDGKAHAALDHFVVNTLGGKAASGVTKRIICDAPAPGLLEAANSADLLVVGVRGLGGFKGMLLGSVSQHCLHHATVPVAVVRPAPTSPRSEVEEIVIGTDGSEQSKPALRWAIAEARRRGAALTVVHSWHLPYMGGSPWVVSALDSEVFEKRAFQVLDGALEGEDASGLRDPVHQRVIHGAAAPALIAMSDDVDLVVVGSRGLGGFSGLLLGSVSQQVTRHARCPVVVVPSEHDRAQAVPRSAKI